MSLKILLVPTFCSETSCGFPDLTEIRSRSPFNGFKTRPDLGPGNSLTSSFPSLSSVQSTPATQTSYLSFHKENFSGPLHVLFPLTGTFFLQNLYNVLLYFIMLLLKYHLTVRPFLYKILPLFPSILASDLPYLFVCIFTGFTRLNERAKKTGTLTSSSTSSLPSIATT